MKQNLQALIVALALITGFSTVVLCQTYAVPRELPIKSLVSRTFPEYKGGSNFPHLIAESFFPIGWSRDGKFAYYVEPVDEACGCYFAHLVIRNMRTDKVLWEFKYNQDDTFVNGNMTGPGSIRALWRKNRKLFSEKLREHKIVASSFKMLPRTFKHRGRSFTASSTTKMVNDPDQNPRVKDLNVSLMTPKLGPKSVYKNDFGSGDDLWAAPLDAGIIGVLKSPYEPRVAIVGMYVNRGWEGPPHTGDILIVGADLTSGFGKK